MNHGILMWWNTREQQKRNKLLINARTHMNSTNTGTKAGSQTPDATDSMTSFIWCSRKGKSSGQTSDQ